MAEVQVDSQIAKQYQKWLEADASARKQWDKADRELQKLIRMAKVGRKQSKVVAISESRGIEIEDQFRGQHKCFTPAFAKRWKLKEVSLSPAS